MWRHRPRSASLLRRRRFCRKRQPCARRWKMRRDLKNAARLLDALRTFGFPIDDLTPAAVADRRKLVEMGVPPVQLHVMSSISGVEWDDVWSDRVQARLGSHERALARAQDIHSEQARGGTFE